MDIDELVNKINRENVVMSMTDDPDFTDVHEIFVWATEEGFKVKITSTRIVSYSELEQILEEERQRVGT